MNSTKVIIPVVIGVIILIVGIIVVYQEPVQEGMEIPLENDLPPDYEIMPEVQEKIEGIEKTNEENTYSPKSREWITSGPFQIDRSEYILGEKIFLRIGDLPHDTKGQVAFLRPLNDTHNSVFITVPFDGTKKSAFNYYVEPQLSKTRGYCTINDFLGDWTVVFRGTDYQNLKFEIIEEILPGSEDSFKPVC